MVVFGLAFFLEGLVLGMMPIIKNNWFSLGLWCCNISDEDRIDELRATCLSVGAMGAITSHVTLLSASDSSRNRKQLIRSVVGIPAEIADEVVDSLFKISAINAENPDVINVLDSPSTYARSI